MISARSILAIVLIGDGVVAALIPIRHTRRWQIGPRWWRLWMDWFIRHPRLTRLLAIGQAAIGLSLALGGDDGG